MSITVDDQPYQAHGPADQTVQQLADEVCSQSAGDDRRLVVALTCDGEAVDADRLGEVLRSPVNRFETVEMRTASLREQVTAALDQAIEVWQRSHQFRQEAADSLDAGRHEEAMSSLQKLLDVLKQVQQTTIVSSQLLGVDLETLTAQGRSLTDILGLVRDRLTELKDGMGSHDFVRVSDLLRYDLAEPLDGWSAILRQLRDAAAA
ncbi:MAG: hypothetical protein HY718_08665 [Planctomycetes bacterium]|nr:hypothetical protein [Planctomycetota bacterium]